MLERNSARGRAERLLRDASVMDSPSCMGTEQGNREGRHSRKDACRLHIHATRLSLSLSLSLSPEAPPGLLSTPSHLQHREQPSSPPSPIPKRTVASRRPCGNCGNRRNRPCGSAVTFSDGRSDSSICSVSALPLAVCLADYSPPSALRPQLCPRGQGKPSWSTFSPPRRPPPASTTRPRSPQR